MGTATCFSQTAGRVKDHFYFGDSWQSFVFTSPWVCTTNIRRCAVTLLLSATGKPFEMEVDGQLQSHKAVLVPPLVERSLWARDVALISVCILPRHPAFLQLARPHEASLIPLDWQQFWPLRIDLMNAFHGSLRSDQAWLLTERAVDIAVAQLQPRGRPQAVPASVMDARHLLINDGAWSIADLAHSLNVSSDRASRIATAALGLPLKSYLCWRKMHTAWLTLHHHGGSSITEAAHEAGFTDSAHLSHVSMREFGACPSYFLDRRFVQLID